MRRAGVHYSHLWLLLLTIISFQALAEPIQEQGYIEVTDGTGLKYTVLLPEGDGPFPVLLQYQGYGAGGDPNDNGISLISERLLDLGFAILGVSLRGTGCSEGSFDLFETQWVQDGVEVINWAANQQWSDGNIAMIGLSFPGMTQLMVGPERPAALKALLPWSGMTDLYRDVAYPGGIFNLSFASAWTGIQKSGYTDVPTEIQEGDTRCPASLLEHNDPERIVFLFGQTHPWADHFVYERFVPEGSIEKINIPVLLTHAWQDEQIASRTTIDYEKINPGLTWHIYGNGVHGFGLGSRHVIETAEAFLLHFLKGEENGFEQTPHVQIQHETAFGAEPLWISDHPTWPADTELAELYFTAAATLESQRPADEGSVDYLYPLPAPSMTSAFAADTENQLYQLPIAPGGAAIFTTPPLAHDLEILGPSRVDIWLSSTASDTDVQVSLTEVRPDGQEMFVQRGWLRASHRKYDVRRSSAQTAYHTHTEKDQQPLIQGEPTRLNIEIWPVGHVFREGSSLRVRIEAPLGTTGFRQLELNPTPAVNTVHVGGANPSRITLPVIPGSQAPIELHDCVGIVNQPCRSSDVAQPSGDLNIPAASMTLGKNEGKAELANNAIHLTNHAQDDHYLRAITLSLPDAHTLESISIRVGEQTVTVDNPYTETRMELPESIIGAGESLKLPLIIEHKPGLTASLSNVAYAGTNQGHTAYISFGLALWLGLVLVTVKRLNGRMATVLIIAGVLAACGGDSNSDNSTPPSSAAEANAFVSIVDVEVVDQTGRFIDYK